MLRLHQALKSSRAAIDLASIMVGIIVIGLIGGVIAATVFAVIPWAQDNAAKQQLDGVTSAESAYRGLSTSKDASLQDAVSSPTNTTDPNQVVLNSAFTGSAGLAVNNLLTLNTAGNYCVIATTDGKDYHAYSKSGSGKWFYSTSGKTQPSLYAGTEVPCLTATTATTPSLAGTVNPKADDGTGSVGTAPTTGTDSGTTPTTPTPVYTTVASYDFEDGSTSIFRNTQTYGTQYVGTAPAAGHGSKSLYVNGTDNATLRTTTGTVPNVVAGTKYRVTAWIYMKQGRYPDIYAFGSYYSTTTGDRTPALNAWKQYTFEMTATNSSSQDLAFQGLKTNPGTAEYYVDDVKVERIS
jgi:type II secretory pathway pseudopilin PulG